MFLVAIDGIIAALKTYDFVDENVPLKNAFDIIQLVILCFYTSESCLQLINQGHLIYKDVWSCFDIVIVIISWLSLRIDLRAFRILRLLRLFTKVPQFKKVFQILAAVLPNLAALSILTGVVFYIFAVVFTSLYKHKELSEPYFVRLDSTMLTLFQIMTMVNWAAIGRELLDSGSREGQYLVGAFLFISGYLLLNLLIGFVCEGIEYVNQENNKSAKEKKDLMYKQLEQINKIQNEINNLLETCVISKGESCSIEVTGRDDSKKLVDSDIDKR